MLLFGSKFTKEKKIQTLFWEEILIMKQVHQAYMPLQDLHDKLRYNTEHME